MLCLFAPGSHQQGFFNEVSSANAISSPSRNSSRGYRVLDLLALTIFSETAEKSNAANGRDNEYLARPFEPFLGCLRVISVNSLKLCERLSARRVTQKHFELHKSIHRRPDNPRDSQRCQQSFRILIHITEAQRRWEMVRQTQRGVSTNPRNINYAQNVHNVCSIFFFTALPVQCHDRFME